MSDLEVGQVVTYKMMNGTIFDIEVLEIFKNKFFFLCRIVTGPNMGDEFVASVRGIV